MPTPLGGHATDDLPEQPRGRLNIQVLSLLAEQSEQMNCALLEKLQGKQLEVCLDDLWFELHVAAVYQ